MRLRRTLALCLLAVLIIAGTLGLVQRRSAMPAPNEGGVAVSALQPEPPVPVIAWQKPREANAPELPSSPQELASYLQAIQRELPTVSRRDIFKLRQFCPADFNRDDNVDETDLSAYLERWQAGDGATAHLADMNRDGVLDESDLTEFLSAYFNNDCDPQRQKVLRFRMPPETIRRVAWRDRTGPSRRPVEVIQQQPTP